MAVIGSAGSGKDVLAQVLARQTLPASGSIRIDGKGLLSDRAAPALGEGRERIIQEFGLKAGS